MMFYSNSMTLLTLLFLSMFSQGNSAELDNYSENKIRSFHVDYKNLSSELCLIGAKYDTDKSSQRNNVTDARHCHPYTLFYNSLFKDKRDSNLAIAELGILYGSSLLMWREYFQKATIYGFEYNSDLIHSFKNNFDNDRIVLSQMNVQDSLNIKKSFKAVGVKYDLIIDDTTHQFEDQLRIIENAHAYLKPGGMLIIEDIFKRYNQQDYIEKLGSILDKFQDYYFISLDHENRCSTGWDNDKLFVLVKAGAEPVFRNKKKMTLITPSIRVGNLPKVKESIDFNYVDEWIIVYDGRKISENPYLFANEKNKKIKEYLYASPGQSGNPQRNYALDHVENKDTYLYFLDDDNTIHKDLYKFLDILDDGKMYTFDQENNDCGRKMQVGQIEKKILTGNSIQMGQIDTAMFLIDFKLCKDLRWALHEYTADFYYMADCYLKNQDKWIYVNNVLSTYNSLSP